jgi:hypothetical protein
MAQRQQQRAGPRPHAERGHDNEIVKGGVGATAKLALKVRAPRGHSSSSQLQSKHPLPTFTRWSPSKEQHRQPVTPRLHQPAPSTRAHMLPHPLCAAAPAAPPCLPQPSEPHLAGSLTHCTAPHPPPPSNHRCTTMTASAANAATALQSAMLTRTLTRPSGTMPPSSRSRETNSSLATAGPSSPRPFSCYTPELSGWLSAEQSGARAISA